jgi:drug/metabolite transporter (DMT)-like permease
VSRWLIIAGAVIVVLGVVLIPLPGPGYPVVILGAITLTVGGVLAATRRRGPRQTP